MFGNSFPSNLTLIKCNANANSSTSRKPAEFIKLNAIVIVLVIHADVQFV